MEVLPLHQQIQNDLKTVRDGIDHLSTVWREDQCYPVGRSFWGEADIADVCGRLAGFCIQSGHEEAAEAFLIVANRDPDDYMVVQAFPFGGPAPQIGRAGDALKQAMTTVHKLLVQAVPAPYAVKEAPPIEDGFKAYDRHGGAMIFQSEGWLSLVSNITRIDENNSIEDADWVATYLFCNGKGDRFLIVGRFYTTAGTEIVDRRMMETSGALDVGMRSLIMECDEGLPEDAPRLVREIWEGRFVTADPGARSARRGKPVWDQGTRELKVDGELVRAWDSRASNVELVLNAFQEEGWPKSIDDPLPGSASSPADRRNDTAKSLNNGHELIQFGVKGESFTWKYLEAVAEVEPPSWLSEGVDDIPF